MLISVPAHELVQVTRSTRVPEYIKLIGKARPESLVSLPDHQMKQPPHLRPIKGGTSPNWLCHLVTHNESCPGKSPH